jgi:hypothetical protein
MGIMIFKGPSPNLPNEIRDRLFPEGRGRKKVLKSQVLKKSLWLLFLFTCKALVLFGQNIQNLSYSSFQDFPVDTSGRHIVNFHLGKSKNVFVTLDPLLQLSGGVDAIEKEKIFDFTGGAKISLQSKKIAFNFNAAKGISQLSPYQNNYIQEHEVIPGMGYANSYKDYYHYNYLAANFWYKPSKYFYLQLGYDKNFIGDGYRSLLLSDCASNYPFLKLSTSVWKLKYVNLFAQFNDISYSNGDIDLFGKKFGAFHYLEWEVTKRLNIGLFETIIWQVEDSSRYRGFDVNYLNPFIFYRPVEFSLGSPDNALMGLNVKLKLWKKTFLYSQIMLDEFLLKHVRDMDGWWANKQAAQLGAKVYDLFGVKNLFIQGEINYVRPYTYSHYSGLRNYGHYNQPLAHILESNFIESVNFVKYNYKKIHFEYEFMAAMKGENTDSLNYGGNIYENYVTYVTEFGNYVGQGVRTFIFYNSLKCSYIFNEINQFGFFIQLVDHQTFSSQQDEHNLLLLAGIQISPIKRYWDF